MKVEILFGVTEAICGKWMSSFHFECEEYGFYVGDDKGLLKIFVCHGLNFIGHFRRCEISKKSHSDCLRALDDAKIHVEDNISGPFLRIDRLR